MARLMLRPMVMTKSVEERFWAKVDRRGPGECWNWLGSKFHFGHGRVYGGTIQRAHRLSWFIHYGSLPELPIIRHKCDNPSCVNPAHLEPGTAADNIADCIARGRRVTPRGEQNGQAKVSDEQRVFIRANPDGFTLKEMANKVRLCPASVWEIQNGRSPTGRPAPRGTAHHATHLTDDDIRSIRAADISMSNAELGAKYGIARNSAHRIRTRRSFRSVP